MDGDDKREELCDELWDSKVEQMALRLLKNRIEAAKLLGTPIDRGREEAVDLVKKTYGVDYSHLILKQYPTDPLIQEMLEEHFIFTREPEDVVYSSDVRKTLEPKCPCGYKLARVMRIMGANRIRTHEHRGFSGVKRK